MDKQNNAWTVILSGFLAFFEPIAGNIFALAWVFVLNFLIGLVVGILVQDESFEMRKALRCIVEAAMFFVLSASVYICGSLQGNPEGATQCVSLFAYVILFFYGRNVLKNLRRLLRTGSVAWCVVDFAYQILSLEVIKSIPGLTKYVKENESK